MTTRSLAAVVVVAVVAALVVTFVVYGGGPSASTPGSRLAAWATSTSLGQDIGTLEGDGAHVRLVLADHKGTAAVHTVCAAMANDAQTFNDQLPTPDTKVTGLLARAYGLEYDAAEACFRAGTDDPALQAKAARDRSQAHGLFVQVLARVDAVTGRSVATTTTTVRGTTASAFF